MFGKIEDIIDKKVLKSSNYELFYLILILLTLSCDKPECKNTNLIFDKYSYEEKEYKIELINQLKLAQVSKISYWIDKYYEDKHGQYLVLDITGTGICAKGIFDITNDSINGGRFKFFKSKKGGGYHGAELKGLRYTIDTSGGKINFVVVEIERISD